MNRDWDSLMFNHVGEKIQKVAKIIIWINIITSIVTGVVLFFCAFISIEYLWWMMLLAPVVVLFGCIMAWLGTIVVYAFGQLVADVHDITQKNTVINRNVNIIAQPIIDEDKAKREAEDKAKREAEDKVKREAEDKAKREAEDKAKREAEDKAKREAEQITKQLAQKKEKTLSEKLAYALMFQTDEGMVSYLMNIQDEAVQDILKSPQHLIREQIQNLLSSM